jgi:hypothetical protein
VALNRPCILALQGAPVRAGELATVTATFINDAHLTEPVTVHRVVTRPDGQMLISTPVTLTLSGKRLQDLSAYATFSTETVDADRTEPLPGDYQLQLVVSSESRVIAMAGVRVRATAE